MQIQPQDQEKRGKLIDTVVDNLGYCLYGLCTFPNMVINANISTRSVKKQRNRLDTMQTVIDSAGVVFTWSVYFQIQ